ncbi:Uncharacterized WD repeat-containing protein alr2800 [Durusdinium trenchii]|uniref:Uncharacterized WD repeat-containing protein alr2800 n=1 Tax=Durusdinium trenchii TaxID=1381693 RepID=A0ABP0HW59_9DINO
MRWFLSFILLLVMQSVTDLAAEDSVSFERDVAPIFRKYCAGCHSGEMPDGEISFESYADLQQGTADGPAVLPGDTSGSLVLRLLRSTSDDRMPPEGEPRPSEEEITTLEQWIEAGALGPQGAEPDRMKLIVPMIPSQVETRPVSAVAWSSNGDAIAIGRYAEVTVYRQFRVTDPETGKRRREWTPVQTLTDFPGKVTSVHFLDGARLIASSGVTGLGGSVSVWKWPLKQKLLEFRGHRDMIYDAEMSPTGETIATCSYDRQIHVWDAQEGTLLRTISGHNGAVYDLAYSPDGQYLVSASADDTCKVWRVADGERLDTMGQPLKEQYTCQFSPDGRFILAGGADNRIRVWEFISRDRPRINPLRFARFAHEGPIVQLGLTADGQRLVSVAEDRTMKVWNFDDLTELKLFKQEPAVVTGLAVAGEGDQFIVGRLDGTWETYRLPREQPSKNESPLVAETDPEQLPMPPAGKTQTVAEQEPNDAPEEATAVSAPVAITGVIESPGDEPADRDLFRFTARAGEEWVIEVEAARKDSKLDSCVEVLTPEGERIERVLLQAVRDSYFTFRGKDANQVSDFRVFNWEEMDLNEYLYANGEVVKLWLYPRGPDSGFNVYPGSGKRWGYFDTTPLSHALGEPCYIVRPHPPGTSLIPNGLPVFPLYSENDDESRRKLGADSRLFFTAPADGDYLVAIRDVRGFAGPQQTYTLNIRPPEFKVSVDRKDQFDGPVTVAIDNLPEGFACVSPIVIEEGQISASGVIQTERSATTATKEALEQVSVTAHATIRGQEVFHKVASFEELKVTEPPKLELVIVESDASASSGPLEVTIRPGETIMLRLLVQRNDFGGVISLGKEDAGRNLPHGVYVDNIGLNGLLLLEGQTEREFFITAADWVPEQSRWFHLQTSVRVEDDRFRRCLPIAVLACRGDDNCRSSRVLVLAFVRFDAAVEDHEDVHAAQVDMEFAGLAVCSHAAPIVQPIGDGIGLLNLGDDNSGTEGVDGSWFEKEAVAWLDLADVETVDDVSFNDGGFELWAIDTLFKTGVDAASWFSGQNNPAFRLSGGHFGPAGGHRPTGVDLHRQIAMGIEELDQQGESIGIGMLAEEGDALKKIDEGTYGLCEGCLEEGKPASRSSIPKMRLKVIPYARLCVADFVQDFLVPFHDPQ